MRHRGLEPASGDPLDIAAVLTAALDLVYVLRDHESAPITAWKAHTELSFGECACKTFIDYPRLIGVPDDREKCFEHMLVIPLLREIVLSWPKVMDDFEVWW